MFFFDGALKKRFNSVARIHALVEDGIDGLRDRDVDMRLVGELAGGNAGEHAFDDHANFYFGFFCGQALAEKAAKCRVAAMA